MIEDVPFSRKFRFFVLKLRILVHCYAFLINHNVLLTFPVKNLLFNLTSFRQEGKMLQWWTMIIIISLFLNNNNNNNLVELCWACPTNVRLVSQSRRYRRVSRHACLSGLRTGQWRYCQWRQWTSVALASLGLVVRANCMTHLICRAAIMGIVEFNVPFDTL